MQKRTVITFILLGFLCLFLGCLVTNYDYDFFARLIVGERFIEHGILPFQDFLSYTPTHAWYDHEWGSGVIFYLVLKYFGAFGILFLHSLLMFCTAIFVYKTQQLQKHTYPLSLLFMVVFLAFFAHLNPKFIRCQMFSFFFFSMFLYILEKYRLTGTKLIWSIPIITVIWNNLHGGIVSGLGILFIYFIAAIINKKQYKEVACVSIISAIALMINPYGIKYLPFLFSAATKNRQYITEWWPFYKNVYYLWPALYGIYAFVCLTLKSIKSKKYDLIKLSIILITLIEGLMHVKLLSLTLIAISSLCYNEIAKPLLNLKKLIKITEKSLYAVIILLSLSIPIYSPMYPRAGLYDFPLYEVEFLKINNMNGNIVVPFGFGSYVSYKLYPNNLIYMDGRYEEVYDDKEFNVLRKFELVLDDWDEIIKKYHTDILMPSKTANVYEHLIKDNNWVHVFDGRICGIFVKKDSLKENYIEPEYGLDYYKRTMFNGYFGGKIRSYDNDR